MGGGSLGASRDEPSVDDADVDCDEQHNKHVVKETKEAKHSFRQNVEWRDEVEQRKQTAQQNTETKHPDETTQ